MAVTGVLGRSRALLFGLVMGLGASGCGGGGPPGGPQSGGPEAPLTALPAVLSTSGSSGGSATSETTGKPATPEAGTSLPTLASTSLAFEARATAARVWVANADGDTVAALDATDGVRQAEIVVGRSPRALAIATDGRVWVSVQDPPALVVIDPTTLRIAARHPLPPASQPFGVVAGEAGGVWVALSATGEVLGLDAGGRTSARVAVGADPRHLALTPDGSRLLVSRFVTRPQPGESPAEGPAPAVEGAEVIVVRTADARPEGTVILRRSAGVDTAERGRGIPNYLGAAAVSPDGRIAWVPSKQDNIDRGALRDSRELDFQSTVRAVSSRIDLQALAEDPDRRIDHDNSSVAAAAVWHPGGRWLFVALETSRQVAVVDAARGREIRRLETGLAPQALAMSPDGLRLFVHSFMSRSIDAHDVAAATSADERTASALWTSPTLATEPLEPLVLRGKQLFHDARDRRLARDAYMSCASCHADGGHDGRVWDFTGMGEGLRNTRSLRGRRGAQALLHWSGNFDEVQDFETQIRQLAGGTGLMRDEDLAAGTRAQPLGDRKAGLSGDLDALAAYLNSLVRFDPSPHRPPGGGLSAPAELGRALFESRGCAQCHGGADAARGPDGQRYSIGTIRPSSGRRLGAALDGLTAPSLRDAWATAPYLHDGSAPTLADAVRAHRALALDASQVDALVRYLLEMEAGEPQPSR
jgi:DNA-binding beta-propeller fold protein YncE